MDLKRRIKAFSELGKRLQNLSESELKDWCELAFAYNKWFTEDSVKTALNEITRFLGAETLERWTGNYDFSKVSPKRVGVVMAGNIPLAGFHDFMSVLISGHKILVKKSSQDPYLIERIAELLKEIEPGFEDQIAFTENLKESEVIIATGSDNSARYFNYYFASRPHIIRKNRTSVAVLSGEESEEEITELGKDIFTYYGLGCRNVSKVFIPEGFKPESLDKGLRSFSNIIMNVKYANNYDYNNAIYLLKKIPVLDFGYLLIKEDEATVSPVAVLYYEFYKSKEALQKRLDNQSEKLQIIVSSNGWFPDSVPFGEAQSPEVTEYADKVDTLKFLTEL